MKEILELHIKWLNSEKDGVRANLSGANLRYANLSGANLSDADLRGTIGNNKEIRTLQLGTYIVVIFKEQITIGCQSHKISEWEGFTDEEISEMDGNRALEWWKEHKK